MTTDDRRRTWVERANLRAERIISAGGWRLRLLLDPEAADALRRLTSDGTPAVQVISRLLLRADKAKRPLKVSDRSS